MSTFSFDSSLSAEANIERFYAHLSTLDANFAALLKNNLSTMLPLSDSSQIRGTRRVAFNRAIMAALEKSEATPGDEPA